MSKSNLLWLIRFTGGGLISYVTPRLLIAFGMPIDRWISDAGAAMALIVTIEEAKWLATLIVGIALISGHAVFKRLQKMPAEIPTKDSGPVLPRIKASAKIRPALTISTDKGRAIFDYSTNNGSVAIGEGDCLFQLAFSKASNTSIHMMTRRHSHRSNLNGLARVKNARTGDTLRFSEYDSSSDHYKVNSGEIFLAENITGYFMQGRIVDIKDDGHGADHDEITFDYQINTNGSAEFVAI